MVSKFLTITITACLGVGAIIAPTVVTSVINNTNNSKSKQYFKSEFDVTNVTKYSNINRYLKSQTVSLFFANFVDSTTYEGSNGTAWLLPNQYLLLNKQLNDNSINNLKFYVATNFHVINNIYNDYDKLFISFFKNPNSQEIINGKFLNIGAIKSEVRLILQDNNCSLLRDYNEHDTRINDWPIDVPKSNWQKPWWKETFKEGETIWNIKKSFNDISVLEINVSKKNNKQLIDFLRFSSKFQEYLSIHSMPLNINDNSTNNIDSNPGLSFFIGSFPIYNGEPKWVLSRYPLIEYIGETKINYYNHNCNGSSHAGAHDGYKCKKIEDSSTYYYFADFYNSGDLNVNLINDDGKKINGVFKDTSRQLSFDRLDIGSGSSGSLAIIVNESNFNYNDDWLSLKPAGIWWGTYSSNYSTKGMINLLKTDDFVPNLKDTSIVWKGYNFFDFFNNIINASCKKS